jgi:ABC-type uncharacterized transport system involved in gliding motility auxiliary subunit
MASQTSPSQSSSVTVFGIIGWLGTLLVFASVGIRFLRPEWAQYQQYAAWAGLAMVLVYVASEWREVLTLLQSRSGRYGSMSAIGLMAFLGILVAVNYLASRQNKRWDLTANQVYSLSDQTVKILKELDAPVTFTVFDRELALDGYRKQMEAYTYQSSKVSAEYIDPEKNPLRARAAEITALGTVLIQYKDRTERVSSMQEQAVANALVKAITGETRKVYFTQGHGEKDHVSTDRTGYSAIAQALSTDNYGVEKVVLAQTREVPADATVLVVAGPATDFLQPEIEAVERYLAKGGKLLALIDPPAGTSSTTPLLDGLLQSWGFALGMNIVVDASGIGQLLGTDASVPVVANYPPHPITENFQLMTAFPLARSVVAGDAATSGGRTPEVFAQTGAQSWAETDLAAITSGGGRVELNEDKGDRPGPISLAAAVSAPATEAPAPPPPAEGAAPAENKPTPQSRVVVIGDSDFASNGILGVQGNRDFFQNTVNWLAQQEGLIAIRPREPEDRRITMTAEAQNMVFWLSIFGIPGFIFALGLLNWRGRR